MSPFCQRLTLRLVRRHDLDHRLDRVRRRAACARAGRGSPSRCSVSVSCEALAQRGGGAGVGAVELAGEQARGASSRGRVVGRASRRARSRRLTAGAVAFGQVVEHVALLVADAALDRDAAPNTSSTAARSALPPSSTTSTPCSTVQAAVDEVGEQLRRRRSCSRCEPSQSPSGTLTPSVVIPERDDAAAALELDPVEHQRRQPHVVERPAISASQVLARAADELAADRRLRRRALAPRRRPGRPARACARSGASRRRRASARARRRVSGSRSAKCA